MSLVCRNVSRSFGATKALAGADFDLAAGTVTALVGDNGSGKSTLLRVCASLLRPDSGEVAVCGNSVSAQPARARLCIGYLGHESMLDPVLTMRENLAFFGRLYGLGDLKPRVEAMIDRMQASAFADVPVAELSRGQEQAAALARALLHNPGVLLLDEPSTGLDAAAQTRLTELVQQEARRGACVLFSTHDAKLMGAAQSTLQLVQGRIA